MSWLMGARTRLRQLFWRAAAEERMDEEIRFHLEMETEKNLRAGMSPAEARRRALIAFGGTERYREELRDGRRARWLEDLGRDLAFALRSLRRAPGFTVAAVLTLGVGVGANAAVFGLVSASLFRPLPFPEPERLVTLFQTLAEPGRDPRPTPWSYPEFAAVRSAAGSFAHLAAYTADDVNLAVEGLPAVRVRAEMVSWSYLPALGVRPVLGRGFLPQEDSIPGAHPVALVGHELWVRELGRSDGVVGQTVRLNGVSLAVIGVLPPGFRGLTGGGEVWIPHAMAPAVWFADHLTTSEHFLSVVGRLRAGASVEQARAEVESRGARAAAAARELSGAGEEGRWTAGVAPLDEARRDPATVRAQLVLAGAVFFVLLIAAVNLSGLLLARSLGRAREMAIRAAMGAGRARLLRQAAVESAVVGLLGGAVGVGIAAACIGALGSLAPERLGGEAARLAHLASFAAPGVDWRVVGFAAAVSLAAGLVAGLVPALRATRGDLGLGLRTGARGSSVGIGSLRRPTVLSWVAVAQVACALVLLVGAGLLLRSFHELRTRPPGFDPSGVVTFRISPPEGESGGASAAALLSRVLERVEAVPGVEAATVSRCTPYMSRCSSTTLHRAGAPETGEPPVVGRHYVGPDHFRALRIPLLRGRALTPRDRAGSPRVAVINETAARRLWPGEDPIGKRVWFGSGGGFASPDSATEIVGVVGDVPYGAPGAPIGPDFYTSYLQFTFGETLVMVRATGDPLALVPSLRHAVAQVDADLPIYDVRTLRERSSDALAGERFATAALGSFAGLGLLLAALGVYGVMSYSVAQRRREIGIRLALGAAPGEVLRLVIGHGASLTAAGLAVGALLALLLARSLSALVAGIGPADPLVFAAVAAVLLLVALLTCYLPARAAARVDPAETLTAD